MNEENKKRLQARIPDGYWKGIDIGEGWEQLVLDLDAELAKIDPNYVISQIKEKFGGLRFYANPSSGSYATSQGRFESPFYQAIAKAERDSYNICEVCGGPGVLREGGWIRTLCDAHSEGKVAFSKEQLGYFGVT